MEVKLGHRNGVDRFPLLPPPILPSLTLRNWANAKRSLKNHFRAIALRWRFQLQDMSKDQLSTKHHFVHIVEGKIMNMDLEQKGQDVKIQCSRAFRDRYQLQEKLQSSLNGLSNYKMHFTLACPRLPPARTTSLIVLVPLIVFCAKCIIGASYARVFGTSRLKTVNEPEGERHNVRSGHWRSALRDIRELDGLDSESSIYSTSPSEEQQISVEDLSHAYKKLDQDYAKFLSECGLSKGGYWRGGTQRPGQE